MDEILSGSSEEEPLWKTPVKETPVGSSEEIPLGETFVSVALSDPSEEESHWEAPVRETLDSPSEEELPGETLGGAGPAVETPKSHCQGKRSDEQCTWEVAQ